MKIVFLSRYQNQINRGAENFVYELSKRLTLKHKVEILSGTDSDSLKKIIEGNYDLVVPINGGMQSLKASLGRFIKPYKVLITGHSGIGRDDIWNIAIAKPDVFIALTEYMKKWAIKWAWGSKVVKINNGVDLDKFKSSRDILNLRLQKPIVLSVGELVWYKNHDKLIKALSKINKGSLLIVGKGEKKEELESLGKQLLGDRFMIANFDYHDMPSVYRSCDLFSLPSWDREAFGIVYLEAMASGLGVVAPNDDSRREIIGEAGLFINVNDLDSYAEALDKGLVINWSKKARLQAEKFSWDKIADEYEKVMLSVIIKK